MLSGREGHESACRDVGFELGELCAQGLNEKPSLLKWLLMGLGPEPGSEIKAKGDGSAIKKAVKCDMCGDRDEGPACVQACPTGAAIRVGPESFFKVLSRGGR